MAALGAGPAEDRADNPHPLPTLDSVLEEDREARWEQALGTLPPPFPGWAVAVASGWPLAAVPGVRFVDLQYGDTADERRAGAIRPWTGSTQSDALMALDML